MSISRQLVYTPPHFVLAPEPESQNTNIEPECKIVRVTFSDSSTREYQFSKSQNYSSAKSKVILKILNDPSRASQVSCCQFTNPFLLYQYSVRVDHAVIVLTMTEAKKSTTIEALELQPAVDDFFSQRTFNNDGVKRKQALTEVILKCHELAENQHETTICNEFRRCRDCLIQLLKNQTVDNFMGIDNMAIALGLSRQYLVDNRGIAVEYYSGAELFRSMLCSVLEQLNNTLGIYQIYTKSFAAELVQCLSGMADKNIEIAAGVGLQSFALREAGLNMHLVTDSNPPKVTFGGTLVVQYDVLEVIRDFSEFDVLYFLSFPETDMMKAMLNLEVPWLALVCSSSSICQVEVHPDTQRQPLTFQFFPKMKIEGCPELIGYKMTKKTFREKVEKIPETFLSAGFQNHKRTMIEEATPVASTD
ncbi:hypothetical protein D5018_19195 [Parashewanella curva]|uniref:Uncharacterized protein n=1 Tax=Parashewanella curva TaxID=2338552 RepID=A0A3L8PRR5_9GAMM|nr:hypothetical protein [Parashewanella curva]RLV58066.1 hypothetical protein D5018_19195 [Parashewanella curva]